MHPTNATTMVATDFYSLSKTDYANRVQIAVYLFVSQVLGNFLLVCLVQSFQDHPMALLNDRLFKLVCQVSTNRNINNYLPKTI